MKTFQIILLFLGLGAYTTVYGETITFDDLTGGVNGSNGPLVPNGYQGLNWNELLVANATTFPGTGYANGVVSPNNIMVIPDFNPQTLPPGSTLVPPATISSTTPFFLVSGYFTAAWLNGVTLDVVGKNGTTTEFDEKFTINATTRSFLTFPTLALTELDFTTAGGDVRNSPYDGTGAQMAVDNLTIDFVNVPEVACTALLLATSAGGLALLRKRFS